MLQANVYLYACTDEEKYLTRATAIADSALGYFYASGHFRDDYWFDAVLLRGFQHLLQYNPDRKYIRGFKNCLDSALLNDRRASGLFGRKKPLNLVAHGGMLEILARYAYLERKGLL